MRLIPKWLHRSETAEQIGARRQEYIRAMRVHSRESQAELLRLVEAADVADLEWLVSRIDEQISGIPLHVDYPEAKLELLRAAKNQRSWISGVLLNKRTVADRKKARRDAIRWIVGIIIAVSGFKLLDSGFLFFFYSQIIRIVAKIYGYLW